MAIVHAQGLLPVAQQVRRAGEEGDSAGAGAGDGGDEGGLLGEGEGGRGVYAALLRGGGAGYGLEFAFVAFDDGEVAGGEERLYGLAADGGCAGSVGDVSCALSLTFGVV